MSGKRTSQKASANQPKLRSVRPAVDRPRSPSHDLQQAFGNSITTRFFKTNQIQPKLHISHPEDEAEREADRVADQVMRMPEPLRHEAEPPLRQQQTEAFAGDTRLQRMCAECEEEDKESESKSDRGQAAPMLRKSATELTPQVAPSASGNIQSSHGGGSPLSPATRQFFEPRLGLDLAHVRVHTGAVNEERAKSINAKAFTVGNEITFAKDAYAPGTHEGRRLLAHELAHVMQQSGAHRNHSGENNQSDRVRSTGVQQQQIQRSPSPDVTYTLRGKAAEKKLAELGGVLITDPDYSDGRKAIVGSHLQFVLYATITETVNAGIYQWTHDGPEGYHMQSLKGVGRPDPIPSGAPEPGGMFVNAHNVGATTIPLLRAGIYKTDAWVRAGVDNNGVFEGYELHLEHSVEAVPLKTATQEAAKALKETDNYQQFHDKLDLQTALLRPGGPNQQNRGHELQITTTVANPTEAKPDKKWYAAQDARSDKSRRLTYHWYVSPQTRDKPPPRFDGKPIVSVAGRLGYDFGVGPGISMTTELGGLWVIWYQAKDGQNNDVGEASYLQTILTESDLETLDKHDDFMERLDKLGGKIEGENVAITGVHVATATGISTQLRLFIGRKKGDPSKFILVDLTPGLDPESHRLEYSSSTGNGVVSEFLSENKYAKGMVTFHVGGNNLSIDTRERTEDTNGQGFFDRLSTNLSIGGMVALGAGILAAPLTRGQSLQVALVVSGALTAAGSAVSLYERLQHAEVSTTGVMIDIAMIANSLINTGTALRSLRGGPAVLLKNRATRFLLWANFATEGVSALLISLESAQQLAEILDSKTMTIDQKRSAVIRLTTNLILSGMMLALSYGQMKEFRTRMELRLGKSLAGQLSDEICMTLSMFEDATLNGLKSAGKDDLGKLAAVVRQEPALINVLRNEPRLVKILPLMKTNTADDLRFTIMRMNAHEAGVTLVNSDRLVNVLKAGSINPSTAMAMPKNTLAALGKGKVLDDLEVLGQLSQSGKIKNYSSWLGQLTSGQESVETAAAWAAAARVGANVTFVDMLQPWGIDFTAWKSRLLALGVKGDLNAIFKRARGAGADALAARGELRAAERARARGIDFEFLNPPSGAGAAQGVKSPEAKIVRGGEERIVEVKTATEPPQRSNWNGHADKAKKQLKAGGKPGEIWFDWTDVDVQASTSELKGRTEIEQFLNGKMTKDRLKEVRYFEILWKDKQGKVWVTSRTRAGDGTLSPVTTVMK